MPDRRNVAPVSWRGGDNVGGTTTGSAGTTTGGGGRTGISAVGITTTSPVSASASITGVTPYRLTLTASTTSSNRITLPWPGSVVGISFYGGATGGGTFYVYLEGVLSDAFLTWASASTGDSETFAAGEIPFDAGDVLHVVSSNSQTVDVYVHVTFLS